MAGRDSAPLVQVDDALAQGGSLAFVFLERQHVFHCQRRHKPYARLTTSIGCRVGFPPPACVSWSPDRGQSDTTKSACTPSTSRTAFAAIFIDRSKNSTLTPHAPPCPNHRSITPTAPPVISTSPLDWRRLSG